MPRNPPRRRGTSPLECLAGAFPWLPPLEIGGGWAALLWDLAEDIEDLVGRDALLLGAGFRVAEVASKDGGLRFTWYGTLPGHVRCGAAPGHVGVASKSVCLEAAVARAQGRALRTCELCGRPGTTVIHGTWWFTLCLEHLVVDRRHQRRDPRRGP